jgi:hypothetical protein
LDHERILALEAQVARLETTLNQHHQDLDIQFRRIAQLQADLDAIRAAWVGTKPPRT